MGGRAVGIGGRTKEGGARPTEMGRVGISGNRVVGGYREAVGSSGGGGTGSESYGETRQGRGVNNERILSTRNHVKNAFLFVIALLYCFY